MSASSLSRLETPREFYEGKWINTNHHTRSLKNIIVKKERFFLQTFKTLQSLQVLPPESRILDLGCGGGWSFFSKVGRVVGLDLSRTSLHHAHTVYPMATQASVTRMPFAGGSFDAVVSLDLLGHIAPDDKPQLLNEVYRVLKPGGVTVHYIETLSTDPLSRFSRSHPDLHERYFVAPEGHIGAESPADTFQRFRDAGFAPVREVPAYKGFIYVDRFSQYFDNEFCERSRWMRYAVTLLRPLVRYRPLTLATNVAITLLFELCDPLLPDAWAGGALVCYRKPV